MASKFGGVAVNQSGSKFGGVSIEPQIPVAPEEYDLPPNVGDEGALTDPTPMLGEQSRLIPFAESMATVGSGAVAEPLAGASSLLAAPFVGTDAAADMVGSISDRFTYQPRTRESQRQLQNVGEKLAPVVEPVTQTIDAAADKTLDVTGSPLLATAVKTAPVLLAELFGLKGISLLRSGTRLLTPEGAPSRELEVMLNNKGLTFEGLTPETRKAIPEVIDRKMIRQLKTDKNIIEGDIQKNQLMTGGRDKSLSKLDIIDDTVVKNPLYVDAVKKGWKESTVQMVKTSNPETKKVMDTMLNMRWTLLKSDADAPNLYPLNAVGDNFHKRIKFIKGEANKARVKLDRIADTKLKGATIDYKPVSQELKKSLDDLGVKYTVDSRGVPSFTFKGSVISKDKTSQKVIKDARDLLVDIAEGGKPDAYKLHIFKRQLDSLIDFKKKSKTGITEEGRRVLKGLRTAANNQLRTKFDDYAEVNDVLKNVLGAMDEFKGASKIDVNFFDDPSPLIGDKLRYLHSRYQSRVPIKQAAERIDKVAADLGGKFDVNYTDLVQMANRMDELWGGSRSGEARNVIGPGAYARTYASEGKLGVAKKAVTDLGEKAKKMAGSSEFDAYQAMKDILNK